MSNEATTRTNQTIGLALSGGGFRALLFHLGVVRALRDLDQLRNVTWVSSVSGGSIIAAHMFKHWQEYISSDDRVWEGCIDRLLSFVRRDIRGRITRRMPLSLVVPSLRRVEVLAREYDALYDGCLESNGNVLPPHLRILTTNLTKGVSCAFSATKFFVLDGRTVPIPCSLLSPGMRVAASSAYPVLFPPVPMSNKDLGLGIEHYQPATQYYTDGGVYDNLGIRAFSQILDKDPSIVGPGDRPPPDLLIISDARGPFEWLVTRKQDVVSRVYRSVDIFMNRIAELELECMGVNKSVRKIWQHSGFSVDTVHLRLARMVDGEADSNEVEGLPAAIQRATACIRTDLDKFSMLEISCLVNLGQRHLLKALGEDRGQTWDPTGLSWSAP